MGSRAAVLMRAPARNATRGPAASLLTRTRPPAIVRAAANPTHGAAPRRAATIPARHGAAGSHIVLQRKLAIGTVNDPLEREADRVAEQVIRMPAPAPVSRASSLQINRKCAECEEEEEKGKLQKKSAGRAAPQTAPPIVHEVLAEPGAPLDAATRAFMEPRFDYDFSRVRVHSGAAATRSAQAVNALAYTVGDRIVLGSAGAGPHLLAHELAHVVQQGSSSTGLRSAQMRRKETTPAPEVKVDPTATCNLEQHRKIEPAAYKADEWLSVAIPALEALVAGARTPAAAKASAALGKHFHSTEQAVATYVIARLKTIQRDLFTRQPFRINCPPASDAACHQNEAFVAVVPAKNENEINLCSRFFERGEPDRASTIIHEFGHTQLGLRDDQKLVDRGYKSDAYYFYLTTGQALTNAESYAMLAREIATGSTPAQGFIADTLYNCPKEWNRSVSDAISTARAWNHTAAVKTVGREQFSLPYKRLDTLLTSSFEFKCVTDAGGRCSNTVVAYWYFFGALRICPSFLAQATADDRAQSILAALYGYKDMIDGEANRQAAALKARRLHIQGTPSAADVLRP